MSALQHSIVFNQRTWPGAGDVDDCWVVSAIQATNVVLPARRLVSVTTFRKAAGDPDDGQNDGGNLAEIIRGSTGCWPELAGKLDRLADVSMTTIRGKAAQGRPLSLAVVSGELPARLRFGFTGLHQVTIVVDDGELLVANPLAPAQSRWEPAAWAGLEPAILAYGKAKAGHRGAWAVAWPTLAELAPPPPPPPDCSAVEHELEIANTRIVRAITDLGGTPT